MIPDPRERPTLTVEQAGAFLGLGRSAAYAAVGRGEIPTIKFGRRIVVPTAALLRLWPSMRPTLGRRREAPTRNSRPGGGAAAK